VPKSKKRGKKVFFSCRAKIFKKKNSPNEPGERKEVGVLSGERVELGGLKNSLGECKKRKGRGGIGYRTGGTICLCEI